MDLSMVIPITIALFAIICVAVFVVFQRQAKAKDKALLSTDLEPETGSEPVRGVVIEEAEGREDDLVAEDSTGRDAEVESEETKDDAPVSGPSPTKVEPDMAETQGCKVLVISDEPEMVELMKLVLARSRGDDVRGALGRDKDLSFAQQDPPDLIIIKLMRPELGGGYDICRRLREMQELKDVPVLFQVPTSYKIIYPEYVEQEFGVVGYLEYSFGPQDLLDARDAVLRGETYYPPSFKKSKTES